MKIIKKKFFYFKKLIRKYSNDLLIFLIVVILVTILNFTILSPTLSMGLHHDDWKLLIWYKSLGANPFLHITQIIKDGGASFLYNLLHIGILDHFFGLDFLAFHKINILTKVFANICLYISVLIISKSRRLAVFSAILFAISYTASANLQWIICGGDYIGLGIMSIFLISYYKLFIRKKWSILLLICNLLLFTSAVAFSPFRLFPLLFIPLFIEVFLIFIDKNKYNRIKSIKRIIAIYWIFIIILILEPNLINFSQFNNSLFKALIIKGDYGQLLIPFSGFGITVIPDTISSKFLAMPIISNFKDYILYILYKPLIFFGVLSIIISYSFPQKRFKTLLQIFLLNLLLEALVYPILVSHIKPDTDISSVINNPIMYSTFLGLYIFSVSVAGFNQWVHTNKKNILLLLLWSTPAMASIFIVLTLWLNTTSFSPIHRYLMVPSAFTSVFSASLILLLYNKLKTISIITSGSVSRFINKILIFITTAISDLIRSIYKLISKGGRNKIWIISINIFIILLIFIYYLISNHEIKDFFLPKINNGYSAYDNELLHIQMAKYIKDNGIDISHPSLFYFDESDVWKLGEFYEQGFTSDFVYWIHLDKENLISGCVGVIPGDGDISKLKQLLIKDSTTSNVLMFRYYGYCVDNDDDFNRSHEEMLFDPKYFYGFKFKGKKVIDITTEMREKLGINKSGI